MNHACADSESSKEGVGGVWNRYRIRASTYSFDIGWNRFLFFSNLKPERGNPFSCVCARRNDVRRKMKIKKKS